MFILCEVEVRSHMVVNPNHPNPIYYTTYTTIRTIYNIYICIYNIYMYQYIYIIHIRIYNYIYNYIYTHQPFWCLLIASLNITMEEII